MVKNISWRQFQRGMFVSFSHDKRWSKLEKERRWQMNLKLREMIRKKNKDYVFLSVRVLEI